MKPVLRFFVAFLFLSISIASADKRDISPQSVSKVDQYLKRASENGYSGSVLVASEGKVLLTKGYGFADSENKIPFTAETIFDIGSITKQFTAACILKLEMQGKLSTQDSISKYFGDVPEDKKSITLHNLLTHTAGLTDSLGPDEEYIGREEYIKKALDSKLIHAPGKYAYSNVGYSLLAAVVEKVSGKEYEHYLAEQILAPAGMKLTGYILPKWDKSKMAIGYQGGRRWGTTFDQSNFSNGVTWHLKGNGGIHSTVGDLYLWYRALQGTKVLSEDAKKKYFAPHTKAGEHEFYAYGWSVHTNDRKQTVIEHNGGNGSFMDTFTMIPQKDYAAIVSTNRFPKNTDTIARRIDKFLFENLEELPPAFITKFSGKYILPSGVTVTVSFNENDEAVVLLNDSESWRLFGGSDSEDSARVKQFDDKTRTLMNGLLTSDVAAMASAAGMEQKDVQTEFPKYFEQLEATNGKCKSFDLIGSVERRNGEYHLSAVRFNCEKQNVAKLIIWHEEQLSGFRDLPDGNTKNFDHVEGNKFFAESNNRRVVFDDVEGKPVMRIQTEQKEVIARRRSQD